MTDTLLDDLAHGATLLGSDRTTGVEGTISLTMREAAEEIRRLRSALATLAEGDHTTTLRDEARYLSDCGFPIEATRLFAVADAIDKATAAIR